MIQTQGVEHTRLPDRPLHLAIGMFDGLHLGHQAVIGAARAAAARDQGLTGVLTFWPHPSALFRPASPTPLLQPPALKRTLLARWGVDVLIEQDFNQDFAGIAAEEFVPWLRRHLPSLTALYVGENWRYGKNRLGDVTTLAAQAQAAALTLASTPRLHHLGTPVSSSRIRDLVAAGDMTTANALLGYAYFSEGTVESGRQLGRTIGFPTLNLRWEPELKPRFGVYAVTLCGPGGGLLQGVANYGVRPTVTSTNRPLLEVHVLGAPAPGYGDVVTVQWRCFLRPESKFDSKEALARQIETDRESALKFFAQNTSE